MPVIKFPVKKEHETQITKELNYKYSFDEYEVYRFVNKINNVLFYMREI